MTNTDIWVATRIDGIILRKAVGYIWVCESDMTDINKWIVNYCLDAIKGVVVFYPLGMFWMQVEEISTYPGFLSWIM